MDNSLLRGKQWLPFAGRNFENNKCYFVPDVHVTDDFVVQGYVLPDHEPRK